MCTQRACCSYTSLYLFKGCINQVYWTLCALNMCLTVTTDVGESVMRSACVKTLALVLGSNLNVVPIAWSSHTLTDMFVDMKYSAVASSRRWHADALRRLLWHLAACVWNIDWDVGCKEQVSGIRTGTVDEQGFTLNASQEARGWRQWLNNSGIFHSFQRKRQRGFYAIKD